MRVAVVWLGRISRDTGGRTYLQEILGPLSIRDELKITVFLTDRDFAVPQGCNVQYVRDLRLGAIGRIALESLVARRIARAGYDVLLAPFNYLPLGWRGSSVVVQHNLLAGKGAERLRRPLRGAYRRVAVARSVRRATRVIAVSEHLKHCLLEWYPDIEPRRLRVVSLAPASELLASCAAQREVGSRTVLVVGAIWQHKRVGDAVDAFSVVARRHDDLKLLIAGPGAPDAQRQILRRAIECGVRDRVELLGNLTHRELARRYRSSSALLFLSQVESFGLPVVEAMALGVPVVARRIPALVEVAGSAPFWVGVDARPSEVAEALDRALSDDRARAEAVSRGLAATARLSWSRTARETAEVLLEAVRDSVETRDSERAEALS